MNQDQTKKPIKKTAAAATAAVRAKKGISLVSGEPLDKIDTSPDDVVKLQREQAIIERVVSLIQRRKRAQQLKRRTPILVRKRNIQRTRLAGREQLMRRAVQMAKQILRKRVAGARGAGYKHLGSVEKMAIDKLVEPKAALIKKMAIKLLPRIKSGELNRLKAVQAGKSTKGVYGNVQNLNQGYEYTIKSKLIGETVSKEDLNAMFAMYEGKLGAVLSAPIRVAAKTVSAAAKTAAAVSNPQGLFIGAANLIGKLSNLGANNSGGGAKKDISTKQQQPQSKQPVPTTKPTQQATKP
ncbi:MAG: hypothetical protein EBZ49_09990, partial [Proteobacteria bacterium]|nr:hypothetical protein [Pseudomonadota bacterium]